MLALALALTATLAFVAWRDLLPRLDRVLDLLDRRSPAPDAPADPASPLPPDLESLAQGESEEWARDQVRERAWELFRATKNWDEAKRILHAERLITLLGGEPNNGVS